MSMMSRLRHVAASGLIAVGALGFSWGAEASGSSSSQGAAPARDYEIWALDQGTHKLHILNSKLEEVGQVDMTAHGVRVPHMIDFTPDYVEAVTGVPAEDVAQFAREFATVQPSVIRMGVALERHAGGGQTVRAVCAIPALAGRPSSCWMLAVISRTTRRIVASSSASSVR